MPVSERSKAKVCGHSLDGAAGSNPAGSMDLCLLLVFVSSGRDLLDELITRPE
jgi:hypothetical protein